MYNAFPSTISLVIFGKSSGISQYTLSPENAAIGCPIWDLITTIRDFPKSFLYLFSTLAMAAFPVTLLPLLLISSKEKSTSGSRPFCTKTQVSPQLSISFPSIVIVMTEDKSYPVNVLPSLS